MFDVLVSLIVICPAPTALSGHLYFSDSKLLNCLVKTCLLLSTSRGKLGHMPIGKCYKSDEKEQAGAIVIAQVILVDFLHS
jgi:hypothetical protein